MKPHVLYFWFIFFLAKTLFPNHYEREKKITLELREEVVKIAKKFLGTPYKAGGNTPTGFDCSGFTQYVYKQIGYTLPRTTTDQYFTLEKIKIPKKGDLVFFSLYKNQVSHVGIYIGNLKFIHSPRTGKSIEIADLKNPYWKKRYIGSRSILIEEN
ncbi:MAG: C40 family peptidase [Leptonema sp. (in: bacteria)]